MLKIQQSLRNEMLVNEEQRSLNEILKEELEKKLFGESCLQNREKLELYLEN